MQNMVFEKWFGRKKKDDPEAPKKTEEGRTLSSEELRAAHDKSAEDVDAQITELQSALDQATDEKSKERLRRLLSERQNALRNKPIS